MTITVIFNQMNTFYGKKIFPSMNYYYLNQLKYNFFIAVFKGCNLKLQSRDALRSYSLHITDLKKEI